MQGWGWRRLLRSKLAGVGTCLYLMTFLCAALYPLFDRRTFSGLVAVLLAWPWIDYLPSAWLPLAVFLNAAMIYLVLAVFPRVAALIRRNIQKS